MSVLIFIDIADDGTIKKASLEALTYGSKLGQQLGIDAQGLVLASSTEDLAGLGKYGISKIRQIENSSLQQFDAQVYAQAIVQAAEQVGATIIVFSNNSDGKAVAPRVAARLKAGLVAGAVALPLTENGFVVKKSVFSGKAFAQVSIDTPIKIISLSPNAFKAVAGEGTAAVSTLNVEVADPKVKVTGTHKAGGEVPLAEAEIVVSGGRGMKGPENWGILEDLAKELHAALACSRPVADAHWRPHNEHVGQTGGAIAPNLYVAVGISGAIQHLAGVNRSKVIVVINKDPEAPFFKAADYGIVGDLFEVVPKLTEALKAR